MGLCVSGAVNCRPMDFHAIHVTYMFDTDTVSFCSPEVGALPPADCCLPVLAKFPCQQIIAYQDYFIIFNFDNYY